MAKERKTTTRRKPNVPKQCFFCSEQKKPWYSDTQTLQRYVTDRGKIIPRSRSGICTKHQKLLGEAIKHARLLAMMPYVARD